MDVARACYLIKEGEDAVDTDRLCFTQYIEGDHPLTQVVGERPQARYTLHFGKKGTVLPASAPEWVLFSVFNLLIPVPLGPLRGMSSGGAARRGLRSCNRPDWLSRRSHGPKTPDHNERSGAFS